MAGGPPSTTLACTIPTALVMPAKIKSPGDSKPGAVAA
jgi:hypothetical protein